MASLNFIIKKFSGVKVLIVGDVMLDRFWWGEVERISPEAPVPVVKLSKTTLVPGGGANVAANVRGLGAEPILVSVVGEDEDASILENLLQKEGIRTENLFRIPDRKTTVKTRVIAHSQHVVRIDQEESNNLEKKIEKELLHRVYDLMIEADILIISDYAKGIVSKNVASSLIKTANSLQKKVIVDPKGVNYNKYKKATLLTPNRSEAAAVSKMDLSTKESVNLAGRKLLRELELQSILITQGENGMTLFEKGSEEKHLEALARHVYDVTGAGDTVIATLGTALGTGASLLNSARLANIAAGIVVEEVGTTAIDIEKLGQNLESLE